jgi:hypothetical protein
MASHTGGPWRFTAGGLIIDAWGRTIADAARDDFGPDEREANGRLIAESPQLLHLVRRVIRLRTFRGWSGAEKRVFWEDWECEARQVVAEIK